MNILHFISMRNVFIAAILCFPGASFAQADGSSLPISPDTKLITYQDVVKADGLSKQLFNRAVNWINVNYKNPADVTKVRNPESGLIEILHRFDLSRIDDKGNKVAAGVVIYTLRLELKDGRYRYTITDMSLKSASRFPVERWLDKTDKAYNPNYALFLTQLDKQVKEVIASLKKGMLSDVQPKKDTW